MFSYDYAKHNFNQALELCKDKYSVTYESILLNMAHCFRKLKDYPAAVQLYEKCLTINPNQA